MIQGARLASMMPHAGAMVLLEAVVAWDARLIRCRTRSHLDPGNPLLRQGRLSAVCGVEYGLQAAALHGALLADGVAQQAGYVARIRDAVFHVAHLSGAGIETLVVEATLERREANGMLYALKLATVPGRVLVEARASVALPG